MLASGEELRDTESPPILVVMPILGPALRDALNLETGTLKFAVVVASRGEMGLGEITPFPLVEAGGEGRLRRDEPEGERARGERRSVVPTCTALFLGSSGTEKVAAGLDGGELPVTLVSLAGFRGGELIEITGIEDAGGWRWATRFRSWR